MMLEEMCSTCIHSKYCAGAYRKNHWCGNHTKEGEYNEMSKMRKRGKQTVGSVESRQQDNDLR